MADLDLRTTALILVDLMPRVIALPLAPRTGTEVLSRCIELADAVRAGGGLVVPVRVERPGVTEQPPGSGLAPELGVRPEDVVIVKRTWGAFHRTGLDRVLRNRKIQTVLVAGLVTNMGVESTGRGADEHGYTVVFVVDAMAGLDADAHRFAVEYMFPKIGTVATATDVTRAAVTRAETGEPG